MRPCDHITSVNRFVRDGKILESLTFNSDLSEKLRVLFVWVPFFWPGGVKTISLEKQRR